MPVSSKTDGTPPMTVSVVFVQNMLSGVLSKGLAPDPWLLEAGIAPDLLHNDAARVSVDQIVRLISILIERLDDEMIGLLSRPMRRGSFALQIRSAIGAPTLEAAIRRIANTVRLLHDDLRLVLAQRGGLAGVELHFIDLNVAANPMVHETLLRVFWRAFAWLVGGRLPVVRFDFEYPRPRYANGYSRIFPAPWHFEADHSAMWFERARLKMPVCRDERAVRAFIVESPGVVLLPTRDTGVAGRVRMHLRRTQPHWPDLEQTALAHHVSASTLQKQLAAEQSSFQGLKDELRRDVAVFRLSTSTISITTLAVELGFSDRAAFQRAFKRWTGYAPGAYRRVGK